MKQVALIFLVSFISTVNAQDFKGIYTGTIFSEKNVIMLRNNGKVIDGTLYISEEKLFVLVGSIKDSELVGTMTYGTGTCAFKADVANGSILFSLDCNEEMKVAHLKKISSNPNKNKHGL